MDRVDIIPLLHNAIEVYHMLCKPICKEYGLAQTALDILLFLANNPQCATAKDITRCRGIQANLVSTYVDALATRGLLAREPIQGNRRSIRLTCTQQAGPIIDRGRDVQERFLGLLCGEISAEELDAFRNVLEKIARNTIAAKERIQKEDLP